jgi:antitoxin VapB
MHGRLVYTGIDRRRTIPTAKLFRNGRSQAVRLPKEFRFEGHEVEVRREGERVILEPSRRGAWPDGYWRSWGKASRSLAPITPLPSGGRSVQLDDDE